MSSLSQMRFFGGLRPNWLIIASIFLILCLFWGGGSRADVQSQIPIRISAIWIGLSALFSLPREQIGRLGVILWLLILLACTIGLQLIPLPPDLWASLPDRELLADGVTLANANTWRPFALVPDRAWNSLFAILPAFAALLLTVRLPYAQRRKLILVLIAMAALSALVGLLQLAGVGGKLLYFYRITNEGGAVGLFANRNHQAVLLAICFPMLAILASWRRESKNIGNRGFGAAIIIGIFLLPMILATGSRSGLILSVIGLVFAILIYRARGSRAISGAGFAKRKWIFALLGIIVILVLSATIFFSRSEALDRIFIDEGPDLRTELLGTYVEMIKIYAPLGSGFGSFEGAFKIIEPYGNLGPSYLNHAHNDLAELLIEGGLISAVLLSAFIAWFVMASVKIWRAKPDINGQLQLARLGTVTVAMLLAASLVDYPLRTPTMSVIFVINCAIIQLWVGRKRN